MGEKQTFGTYRFPCGCSFPILEPPHETPADTIPLLDIDIENVPQDCPAVWELLAKGYTKGVFQLESNLGKTYCKKLKPESGEHLSALSAILRPGVLKVVDEEGLSMTQHYCRRKNGEEEVKPFHSAIDPILFISYGVMIYQESVMSITQAVAGFNLQDADSIRKAMGKKDTALMAECEQKFLKGAKESGLLSDDAARTLFDQIKKSQRYLFNHSHAICYGLTGYDCAYVKAHFPVAFFASWLRNARHKQDPQQEKFELINDARLFNITVEPPDLLSLEPYFFTDRKVVKFGLADVKGIGEAQVAKLKVVVDELKRPLSSLSWYEFLTTVADRITSSVVTRLIEVGAFRWTGLPRQVMLAEFKVWESLTKTEKPWFAQKSFSALIPALREAAKTKKEGGACANKKRVPTLQSQLALLEKPPTPLVDSPNWIAYVEEELLGISLSCSRIDACDISQVNCSCKDYISGQTGYLMFGVEVQTAREIKTKKGKTPGAKMAYLTISDSTCSLDDVVCFPDVWKEFGHLLTEGNTVIIHGERDHRKDSNQLIVKKVWQLSQIGA